MFGTVFIIGLGLMGGSLAIDLKKKKLAKKILGHSRKKSNLDWAKKHKIIDEAIYDLKEGIERADLIILGVPVEVIPELFKEIKAHAKDEVLVIDLGSTKAQIINSAKKILPKKIHFIGCHPMTGLETTGVKSAQADLYKNKKCILTPVSSNKKNLDKVKKLWIKIGSEVLMMNEKDHDKNLAFSSHLPQIISYVLDSTIQKNISLKTLKTIIGNGYRDTTRIAGSGPEMWMDIIKQNRKNILVSLKNYREILNLIIDWIENKQDEKIFKFFDQTSKNRKKIK